MHAEAVPARKEKYLKDDNEEEGLEQLYDSRLAETVQLYERYTYDINEVLSTIVDVEIGKRNIKEFWKRHRNDNHYVFIKMFDKLIFFQGSMHSDSVKIAKRCDAQ